MVIATSLLPEGAFALPGSDTGQGAARSGAFLDGPPRSCFRPGVMWVRTASFIARLHRDGRGSAMTEYTILLGTVALASAGSFIAVGVALYRSFAVVRNLFLVPFP